MSRTSTQDFYAHSTMADVDWVRWLGKPIVIFETLPDDIRLNPKLRILTGNALGFHSNLRGEGFAWSLCTGSNPGSGCWPLHLKEENANNPDQCREGSRVETCGVNKDAYHRRYYLVAREMAAASTQHWANKYKGWVNDDAFWDRVKAYSHDQSAECFDRAHGMSVFAGQWGKWKLRGVTESLGVAAENIASGCGDAWQDQTFNDVFLAMYENVTGAPANGTKVTPITFAIPSRGAVAANSFIGTYDTSWGTLRGVLTLQASGDSRTGAWVIGNAAPKAVRRAKPNGNALDITVDNGPTGRTSSTAPTVLQGSSACKPTTNDPPASPRSSAHSRTLGLARVPGSRGTSIE